MTKDIIIQYLKTQSISRDKIIVDVTDIIEVDTYGWDFTLIYRFVNYPFEENETLHHQFISKENYNFFEEEYLKREDARNKKKEELKVATANMRAAHEAYEKFMIDNSVEVPYAPINHLGMFQNPLNNPDETPRREFRITANNVEEYRRLQNEITYAQETLRQVGAELSQL